MANTGLLSLEEEEHQHREEDEQHCIASIVVVVVVVFAVQYSGIYSMRRLSHSGWVKSA